MKICLTCKIIVCVLLCVFPVDIKGQTCQCTNENGGKCKSCNVGCYLVSNYWCYKCPQKCYSCSSINHCDVCKTGYYGPRCDHDCISCRNGSCANNTCTDGCADGHYYDGYCRPCLNKCVICNSYYDCPSCIAGRNGSYCQYCKYGYYNTTYGYCQQCPDKCVTCNSYNYCPTCIAGRTGSYCQNCRDGYYHYNGQCLPCNTNCLHGKCKVHNGKCTDGCKDGWSGPKCQDACAPSCYSCERYDTSTCSSCSLDHYGTSCERECSSNCVAKDDLRQCSFHNGDCNYGCVDDWTGSKCTEKCDMNCISCDAKDKAICHTCRPRFYGKSCENQCSLNCVKTVDIRQCRKSDGQCTDGCVEGWTGYMCTEQCAANCTSCNRWNETACTSCKPGYYGPSCNIECSANCGNMSDTRQCQQDDGTCLADCLMGYKGDKCDVLCDAGCRSSCDRNTDVCHPCRPAYFGPSCQHICNATCYDPGNGSNVCHQLSGECLFDCSQLLCSLDGETQDAQTIDNVAVIGGAVGSAVMIVLVVAAVLVFMFLRKRQRKMSDPERRVTYDNSVNIEDDNVYSVPDKKKSVYQNVDKTQSTAHSTLSKLTPSNGLITHVDVLYGNVGVVPVIPSRLGVDDPEDNVEELYEDVAKSEDLKAHYTNLSPSLGPVPNREDHYTALTPSLGPVYEQLDKNDDVGYGHIKDHYTALTPSLGPVYEELDKNDDVGYGHIKDYEVPTTSNHYTK